jgi:uncharacterized protein (DUF1697 family)
MTTYVALLYSIIISPQRRVLGRELRDIAGRCGFHNPRTLFATGNLIFESDPLDVSAAEDRLEAGFLDYYGKPVDIIVRASDAWRQLMAANPFPGESYADPSKVIARIMRRPVSEEDATVLAAYATQGEQFRIIDGDLWVSFRDPPNQSKLLPVLTPKRLGGAGTIRNWNTIRGLGALLDRHPGPEV